MKQIAFQSGFTRKLGASVAGYRVVAVVTSQSDTAVEVLVLKRNE